MATAPDVEAAIGRARDHLLALQHADGRWQAPVESNAQMEAEWTFVNRLVGRAKPELAPKIAARLAATQESDGGWALYPGGPGHLSTSIEAYFALKLLGRSADDPVLVRGREFILAHGGLAKAGVLTRIWLGLFGQFPWRGIPAIPIELVLLPAWFPVNAFALSSWVRATLVPLALLVAHRHEVHLPRDESVPELWVREPTNEDIALERTRETVTWRNAFLVIDRGLELLGRGPWKPLRRRAVAQAIEWLLRHQDPSGVWAGMQPSTVHSLLALWAIGFAPDHPIMLRGFQGFDDLVATTGDGVVCQPFQSAGWDTAFAARALLDIGCDPNHAAMEAAARWMLAAQVFKPGDWSVRTPGLDPGGWPLSAGNEWYPSVDVSAVMLGVLLQMPVAATDAGKRAVAYGTNWTFGMQSRNGGYGAFDVDNMARFFDEMPFGDVTAMTDPPADDVTGRVLSAIAAAGYGTSYGRARQAVEFLKRTQRPDGSWSGRWGVNGIAGTWSALTGLVAVGEDRRAPHVRRGVEWLLTHQNPDGGFGESPGSYDDPNQLGRGESTPTQTAWAVMGLLAVEGPEHPAVLRAVEWLVAAQAVDGTWDERQHTVTIFPRHMYARSRLFPLTFPLMALGRWRHARAVVGQCGVAGDVEG